MNSYQEEWLMPLNFIFGRTRPEIMILLYWKFLFVYSDSLVRLCIFKNLSSRVTSVMGSLSSQLTQYDHTISCLT